MTEQKKLYRSSRDRVLAGVCGGLAEYFNIDPVIVRLAFVALAALDGIGVFIYIILAIITPSDNRPTNQPKDNLNDFADSIQKSASRFKQDVRTENRAKLWLGIFLSCLGILMLADNFIPTNIILTLQRLFWPLVIIAIGIYLIGKKA